MMLSASVQRALVGLAMGATAVALICSPWGKRSGAHMNPARSFASALPSWLWSDLWIYFLAPVFGMQAAAAWYTYRRGPQAVACAKLQHRTDQRCIHRGYTPPAADELVSRTSEVLR